MQQSGTRFYLPNVGKHELDTMNVLYYEGTNWVGV